TEDSESATDPAAPHPLGACSPDDPITVRFNNRISDAALGAIITAEPVDNGGSAVKLDFSGRYEFPVSETTLPGEFLPGKTYRVLVRPSATTKPILDEYEQPLTADFQQTVHIGDRRPEVRFGGSGTYWMPQGTHVLPTIVTNVNNVVVTARPRSREEVIAALESGKDPAPPKASAKRFSPQSPPHN